MAKAIPSPFQTLWAESWELICSPSLKDKGVGALLAIFECTSQLEKQRQPGGGCGTIASEETTRKAKRKQESDNCIWANGRNFCWKKAKREAPQVASTNGPRRSISGRKSSGKQRLEFELGTSHTRHRWKRRFQVQQNYWS
ncbi:uncharacterized protein LOC106145940 isoform X1 [Columba livia]|uniref:uncharacterized protein LOC106145940 isoform X1 n=1 Tax=Columba livia TaxID=8932 RepID=UPI0031BB8F7C